MHESRRMYLFLAMLCVASAAGLQGWSTLFNNFAVEVAGLDGLHVGIIQSVREVPGFLALFVVWLLILCSEHRLAALSIMLLGAGVACTGLLPSFTGLLLTTLAMSFGFHYFETLNQSLTLQYFDRATVPVVLGRLRSVGAATNIAVGTAIWLMSGASYTSIYGGLGAVIICLGFAALFMNPSRADLPQQQKRMVLRRRYWLFYLLTFLSGARRQIFIAFAVFLLVQRFGFSVREVTTLFVLNNLINWMANPLIGRMIGRMGERRILSLEYMTLFLVFLTYAFTENRWLAAAMYVLDNLVFNFAMAINTFFHKIGDREDIAPTMAVGFTINHIAAVVIPALGGLAWMTDYRIVFLTAAGLSLCSLTASQFIDGQLARRGEGR